MDIYTLAVFTLVLSISVLAYTFVGYGILMQWLARLGSKPLSNPQLDAPLPEVCVIFVARNEEKNVVERLQNLLHSDYPPEKLRLLLVSDHSTDETVARAQSLGNSRLEIMALPERSGKAAGLNAAFARCESEIVVLTDARQRFATDSILRLARHFSDPCIGAVSGALEIAPANSTTGSGVDAYWRYEKALRTAESRIDSCIGCTGAIYALRRTLFQPVPPDTILDDVLIPMQAALKSQRVIHDASIHAFDPQPLDPAAEQRRKKRTLAGNFQILFRYPSWILPWRNRLWWQLVSHKYLRLTSPFFLILAFTSNAVLVGHPPYALLFFGQLLFYSCAALGIVGGKSRILSLPAGFVFLNFMTLRGLAHYLTAGGKGGWA